MPDSITISKTSSIRECGYDEYWLQDQVFANPSILGLGGQLEVVSRERQQPSGGRLDLLLGDSDSRIMYEVELMLGATDETHIIRTLEYWDLERRPWPRRMHTPVLVAETVNRRFFNVIQLLSLTIPIIAIQANLIEANGKRLLHFTKILDAYQEPEMEERATAEVADEIYWKEKAVSTLDVAKSLPEVVSRVLGEVRIGFTKKYIRLLHGGEIRYSLAPRSGGKSAFFTWLKNSEIPSVTGMLDAMQIPYDLKAWDSEWQTLRLTVDQNLIQTRTEAFEKIAEMEKRS